MEWWEGQAPILRTARGPLNQPLLIDEGHTPLLQLVQLQSPRVLLPVELPLRLLPIKELLIHHYGLTAGYLILTVHEPLSQFLKMESKNGCNMSELQMESKRSSTHSVLQMENNPILYPRQHLRALMCQWIYTHTLHLLRVQCGNTCTCTCTSTCSRIAFSFFLFLFNFSTPCTCTCWGQASNDWLIMCTLLIIHVIYQLY